MLVVAAVRFKHPPDESGKAVNNVLLGNTLFHIGQ